jgi:hypothetical protein
MERSREYWYAQLPRNERQKEPRMLQFCPDRCRAVLKTFPVTFR